MALPLTAIHASFILTYLATRTARLSHTLAFHPSNAKGNEKDSSFQTPVDGGSSHVHHRGDLVHRHRPGFVQTTHFFDLLLTELGGPSTLPSAGARGFESGAGAFTDQVAFELCERSEDVEHERAARSARVDRFGQRAELHSPLVERGHQVD